MLSTELTEHAFQERSPPPAGSLMQLLKQYYELPWIGQDTADHDVVRMFEPLITWDRLQCELHHGPSGLCMPTRDILTRASAALVCRHAPTGALQS